MESRREPAKPRRRAHARGLAVLFPMLCLLALLLADRTHAESCHDHPVSSQTENCAACWIAAAHVGLEAPAAVAVVTPPAATPLAALVAQSHAPRHPCRIVLRLRAPPAA